MNTVSIVDFRQHAEQILKRVQDGERLVLTYRGKAVARMLPMQDNQIKEDDPIYCLASKAGDDPVPVDNEAMDRLIYEA